MAGFAAALRELGPANFLYATATRCSRMRDRRHQSGRRQYARPGMWRLSRHCHAGGELAAGGLRIASPEIEQEVVLVASVPLTAEGWVALGEGEIIVARDGRIVV